jgi:hypothetical protein
VLSPLPSLGILGSETPFLPLLRLRAMPPASPAAAAPPASSGVFAFETTSLKLVPLLALPVFRLLVLVPDLRRGDAVLVDRALLPPAAVLVLPEPLDLLRELLDLRLLDAALDPLERLPAFADRVLPPLLVLVCVWAIQGSSPP